jgi:hypothetical protein
MSNIHQLAHIEAQKKVLEVFSTDEKFCYDRKHIQPTTCYMVADALSALECLEIIRGQKINCVLQNSLQSLTDKLSILKLIDYRFEDYFNNQFSFLDTQTHCTTFTSDDQREGVIEKTFQDAMLDMDMSKYLYVYQVALELVMNAQIDAPKISGKIDALPSQLVVEKNLQKGLVAISVIDYYGSLNCYKMLDNIYAAHKDGFRGSMSKNAIGAGLGSALIYEHSESLVLGVMPDQMSRVTAILPYGVSEKRMDQIQKSIHIIKG